LEHEVEQYMLDTNTASYVIKDNPRTVRERMLEVPMASLCISAITQAELLHGVARRPEAKQLPRAVREFLLRIDILPWDCDAAESYAKLRAHCERAGTPLGIMDMLIAAHAIAAGAMLVTSDRAFYRVGQDLRLVDWTQLG
jgi:tRNA(fMet)-specific endonuclease VapC